MLLMPAFLFAFHQLLLTSSALNSALWIFNVSSKVFFFFEGPENTFSMLPVLFFQVSFLSSCAHNDSLSLSQKLVSFQEVTSQKLKQALDEVTQAELSIALGISMYISYCSKATLSLQCGHFISLVHEFFPQREVIDRLRAQSPQICHNQQSISAEHELLRTILLYSLASQLHNS